MTKITMTKEIALTHKGTIYLYNLFNADKTNMRCKPSGKCQTWKKDTNRFKLPVKHGLYDHGYITEDNMTQFYIEG